MAPNTQQARTITTEDHGKLDVRALVLLAVLLAAGFILNFTVGKAISSVSGGMISPEFIISAFCLTILVIRPERRPGPHHRPHLRSRHPDHDDRTLRRLRS
jgi:hypothetical protein